MKRPAAIRSFALTLTAAGLLLGCAGGIEGELFKSCMTQPTATEEGCKCFARETSAKMPAPVARAMSLKMQKKEAEADALMNKMSFEERAKFGMQQFEIVAKCLMGGQN